MANDNETDIIMSTKGAGLQEDIKHGYDWNPLSGYGIWDLLERGEIMYFAGVYLRLQSVRLALPALLGFTGGLSMFVTKYIESVLLMTCVIPDIEGAAIGKEIIIGEYNHFVRPDWFYCYDDLSDKKGYPGIQHYYVGKVMIKLFITPISKAEQHFGAVLYHDIFNEAWGDGYDSDIWVSDQQYLQVLDSNNEEKEEHLLKNMRLRFEYGIKNYEYEKESQYFYPHRLLRKKADDSEDWSLICLKVQQGDKIKFKMKRYHTIHWVESGGIEIMNKVY